MRWTDAETTATSNDASSNDDELEWGTSELKF